jgi:hypothetical protein
MPENSDSQSAIAALAKAGFAARVDV